MKILTIDEDSGMNKKNAGWFCKVNFTRKTEEQAGQVFACVRCKSLNPPLDFNLRSFPYIAVILLAFFLDPEHIYCIILKIGGLKA